MQNPIQKIRQSSIVFEKPGIFLKTWKLWRAPTTVQFNTFCWKFAHIFFLPMSTKGHLGVKLFRSCVIKKNVKKSAQKPGLITFLLIAQGKKNSQIPFCRHW